MLGSVNEPLKKRKKGNHCKRVSKWILRKFIRVYICCRAETKGLRTWSQSSCRRSCRHTRTACRTSSSARAATRSSTPNCTTNTSSSSTNRYSLRVCSHQTKQQMWKFHKVTLGRKRELGGSKHRSNVLASPLPVSTKRFKLIWLQQIGFECLHHLWVSLPSTCIHIMQRTIHWSPPPPRISG